MESSGLVEQIYLCNICSYEVAKIKFKKEKL